MGCGCTAPSRLRAAMVNKGTNERSNNDNKNANIAISEQRGDGQKTRVRRLCYCNKLHDVNTLNCTSRIQT